MTGSHKIQDAYTIRYVALYCRVSTDEQAREGVSLDEQQERLKAYCRAMGWSDQIQLFIDDGYSAKNLDRPELKRLLQAVKSGSISRIMVTKLDRMSRRLLDLLNIIDLFQESEVSFVSISESFDTNTPSGRLTLQVLGAVAEFERERIRERVFENMLHAASTGKWLTQSPYGYDLIEKALVINVKEADVVKRIFDSYLKGNGFYSIAKMLNEEGIPSRQNKEWSIRSIKLMLSNPAYKGTLVWNRQDSSKAKRKEKDESEWIVVENCLPVIIDNPIWGRAQNRMGQKSIASRAKSSPHLLGGLLKCGNCGSGMSIGFSGSVNNRYRVYRCSANKNKGTCTSKQYKAEAVEDWFKEGLLQIVNDETGAMQIIAAAETVAKSQRNLIEQKIQTARARYKRKVEAFTAGLIEIEDLNDEKTRLDQYVTELEAIENGNYDNVHLEIIQHELNEKIHNIISAIEILPVEKAKAILQTFVLHVVIKGEEDIEIHLYPL